MDENLHLFSFWFSSFQSLAATSACLPKGINVMKGNYFIAFQTIAHYLRSKKLYSELSALPEKVSTKWQMFPCLSDSGDHCVCPPVFNAFLNRSEKSCKWHCWVNIPMSFELDWTHLPKRKEAQIVNFSTNTYSCRLLVSCKLTIKITSASVTQSHLTFSGCVKYALGIHSVTSRHHSKWK